MTEVEDRLREFYRDEAAGLEVPDLLPGVLVAGQRARRRSRLVSAVAAAVAMTAVVAVTVAGPSARHQTGGRLASRPFTVITRTDLAGWGPVSGMAAVPGGVWLASWQLGGLVRIDAHSGLVTARVPVGSPQVGPYSIAYGAGSLWVSDFQTGDLLRLNPVTGKQIARIRVPAGIRDVAFGGGFTWVSLFYGNPGTSGNRLVKISPVTDQVLAVRLLPGNRGPGGPTIAASALGLWAYGDGGSSVESVDPASLRLRGSARTGAATYLAALAAGGRYAWALIDGTLFRIDPPSPAVARRVRLFQAQPALNLTIGAQAMAAGQVGTLWTAGSALYRVDESTMRATKIDGFGAVDDVAVTGAMLWLATDDGYVYQVAVNRPSTTAAVPAVVMDSVPAARQLLARDGFSVRVMRRVGLEPLRVVIFQSPAAGSLVPAGTTVTLFISAGPARSSATP